MEIFEEVESQVRGYIRSFPTVFDTARGAELFGEDGKRYVDFFAGAGGLNYGHNEPRITQALIDYLGRGGIVHALDKATVAKRAFLEGFVETILKPRDMTYRIQFCGPTGANAVEAALKLARKVKKRSNVISFTNGYHGLTMGALAVTGNSFYRDESYGARANVAFMPFDGWLGEGVDTLGYLRRYLEDGSSGVDLPAAAIVETVQGEGGINVASVEWLQGLEKICREFDILLIVDDIQMGNGRTGPFFSFERAGLSPDMITVSKSIGGGLPMALLLMKPEYDQWRPGEHSGTFRGNSLAFVAAAEALAYWKDGGLQPEVERKGQKIQAALEKIVARHPQVSRRGVGMAWGLDFNRADAGGEVSSEAFHRGLVIESCGADDSVLKLLPPLITPDDLLDEGLGILAQAVDAWAQA